MSDVRKALAAAVKVNAEHRITGVYPTTSEEAVRAIILAFLWALPEEHVYQQGYDKVWEEWTVAGLIAAIEKETP